MIQLKVTWNNATSSLISNARADDLLVVAQNNAAAAEDKGRRAVDARFFTLVDDGPVKVTFDLKLDHPSITPNVQTMLKVVQRFDCKGGAISSHSYDTDIGPVTAIPGTHPLVSMPGAQQANGAAVMVITTDFVDVTIPWFAAVLVPGTDARNVWNKGPHFDANFRVLACLNGTPKLWYASIPNACVKATAVSALVFFRPAGYSYQGRNDDFESVFNAVHNDRLGLNFFKIWRFLMDPVCDRASAAPSPMKGTLAAEPFHGPLFFDHFDRNANVPAGMERALKQADKPVVMLLPVPDGSDYGSATSKELAGMARIAVACLHSMGIVMRDSGNKTAFSSLKRLGIAGFSFGGTALWAALHSAVVEAGGVVPKPPKAPPTKKPAPTKVGLPNQIKEIYAFDANGWVAKQSDPSDILTTALQTGDLRLRVVAASKAAANLKSIPASGTLTRSAHPDFAANPDVYDLAKTKTKDGNPNINRWYHHFAKAHFDKLGAKWFADQGKGSGIPDERTLDRGARHQFSVFGGDNADTGDTFFCRFLKESGF